MAVTRGKAPVNGGWHNIPRRVSGKEGRDGEVTVDGGAGMREALRCHRNVSLCQVQSTFAVIF